jgi:hypothetical protein
MTVEELYPDVLQNIEWAIVAVFRRNPTLVDFDVENAINALMAKYKAEAQNHEPRLTRLNERAQEVYVQVEAMCELRLGRNAGPSADMKDGGPQLPPVSLDVMLACLKRIRKSIQTWNKQGGRQGYLTFIQRFIV